MKILILNWRDTKHPEAGGAERHIHEIASRWVKLGHNVSIICSAFRNAVRYEVVDGIQTYRVGNNYTVFFASLKQLLMNRTFSGYDVIFESINTIPFFSPIYANCPVVGQIYSIENKSVLFQEMKHYLLPVAIGAYIASSTIPRIYRKCEITTISQYSKELLVKYGFDENRIHVAYPGISNSWLKLVEDNDDENNVRAERPNPSIVHLGRLKKYKGIQDILRAIPIIKKHIPEIKLRIVGRGDYEHALRNIVKALHIQDNVEFCGFVSDREKAYILKSSSIYICTSRDEGGWTIAAIEAMSAGVPVIVTESQKDVVEKGKNGILLASNDPHNIAEKVLTMLSDKPLWKKLSTNALSFSKRFSWEDTAAVTLRAIQTAYEKGKRIFPLES